MTHKNKESDTCCPKFDPDLWNEKTHNWDKKLFIKDTVRQFLHMPRPSSIQKTIGVMWQKAQDAKAEPEIKDFLLLATDPSPWRSELYMTVAKKVPDAENVKLSGIFLSKVFDGPYNAVPKWIKEMEKYVSSKGKKTKKHYIYFTTCPKCAKIYGHNYAVAFTQVE